MAWDNIITSVRIRRYKVLEDLTVDGCRAITLIGGDNNVGKTSLLESLFIFADRTNPHALIRPLGWRGITAWTGKRDEFFSPMFSRFDTAAPIQIEIMRKRKSELLEMNLIKAPGNGRREAGPRSRVLTVETLGPPPPTTGLNVRYRGASRKTLEDTISLGELKWLSNASLGESPPAAYVGVRMGATPDEDAGRFVQLDIENRAHEAVTFVKKFFTDVQDITHITVGDKPLLFADVGMPKKIPVPALGEGAARLLSMFLAISTSKGGYVLLDEIGIGLHWSRLTKMWTALYDAASQYGVQVFATTHSRAVQQAAASAMREVLEPDFCYTRLDKTQEGIVARIYELEQLDAALERGWEVR